ncbi:MAG: hypothetical protein IPG04_41695 [Polyangiaceae bacterium]|nr:hypothetical protein [Polyangiaceae bacterium]
MPPVAPPAPVAPEGQRAVLLESRLDPADPEAVSRFLAQAREALQGGASGAKGKLVRVALVREEDL